VFSSISKAGVYGKLIRSSAKAREDCLSCDCKLMKLGLADGAMGVGFTPPDLLLRAFGTLGKSAEQRLFSF
jgi:hypothetical protein